MKTVLHILLLYLILPFGGAALIVTCAEVTGIGDEALSEWAGCDAPPARCEEAEGSALYH